MSANEDTCVNVAIPFGDAFATMSTTMRGGDRTKLTDPANLTLEASRRHGINMFGLHSGSG